MADKNTPAVHRKWIEWLSEAGVYNPILEALSIARADGGDADVFPPETERMAAFERDPSEIKVCILGQDPYYNPGEAHGLSFSVKKGIRVPRSLSNIYKELDSDTGTPVTDRDNGELTGWADQGVFLLNSALTVRKGLPGSHSKIWSAVTDSIISTMDAKVDGMVFILWGGHAGKKAALVKNPKNLTVQSPHPSPLSARRGFFGSQPFSTANAWLVSHGREPIDWSKRTGAAAGLGITP